MLNYLRLPLIVYAVRKTGSYVTLQSSKWVKTKQYAHVLLYACIHFVTKTLPEQYNNLP